MTDRKNDARVRYTKMMIRTSFIAILREKPVSKVTVTEICEAAGINRATFYAHYSDVYALLESIEHELIEDVSSRLEKSFKSTEIDLYDTLTGVFEYIRENSDICGVLLSDSGETSFAAQVVQMLQRKFIAEWAVVRSLTREEGEWMYIFAAIGSVGLIRKWLGEGMKKSANEMAELIIKLANNGFSAFEA